MKTTTKSTKTLTVRVIIAICLAMLVILSACTQTPTETADPSLTDTSVLEPTETAVPTATSRPSPTPTTPPVIDISAEDLAGIALRFMHPWTGETAEALVEIAMQFSLTNPWDIWVEVEGYGGETALLEALLMDIEVGNPPDLIAVHPYLLDVLDGAYPTVPITDYVSDPNWGVDQDTLEDIPSVFLAQFTQNNELIAMPVAPQATVLFYNQTWAESLGFASFPEDEAGFRQQSCAAAFANRDDGNPDNAGTGGWFVSYRPNVLSGWLLSFGGDVPESGNPQFDTEAGREAYGYIKEAFYQGCFWTGRQAEPYFYFANRYALSYAGALDEIPVQAGWMDVAESEDQWTVTGIPGPESQVMVIDGPGLMIGAASPENQLAAWLFTRRLLDPEVQSKLVPTLFSLPVRRSALPLLDDFVDAYPQWGAGVALLEDAVALPVSEEWGLSQWLLQDAVFRLLQMEDLSPKEVLEELDQMILELEGTAP